MKVTAGIGVLVVCMAAAVGLPGLARAQHEGDRHWHGGDIRYFHSRDLPAWRAGRWYHGYYGGRMGWWWTVGGVYYWYPQPVYPYPDPYIPPVVAAPSVPGAPPPRASPPPASAQPPVPQAWYYCESAKNYYPYVPSCPEGWRAVPATPPA